jgi:hypothetical protein
MTTMMRTFLVLRSGLGKNSLNLNIYNASDMQVFIICCVMTGKFAFSLSIEKQGEWLVIFQRVCVGCSMAIYCERLILVS